MSSFPLHCQILRPRQDLRPRSVRKFYIILQFSHSLLTHLQHSSFTPAGPHSASMVCSISSFLFHFTTSSFLSLFSHPDIDSSGISEHSLMDLNTSFSLHHLTQYWRWHFLSSFNEAVSVPDHPYPLHYDTMLPHDNVWNDSEAVQWWKLLAESVAFFILNLAASEQHFHSQITHADIHLQ